MREIQVALQSAEFEITSTTNGSCNWFYFVSYL